MLLCIFIIYSCVYVLVSNEVVTQFNGLKVQAVLCEQEESAAC